MRVPCSTIIISQKKETNQLIIKQNVVCIFIQWHIIHPKKEKSSDICYMDES